jgi:outer membrane biosynthesis protein TonB
LESIHPAAVKHFPVFIAGPGQTDYLFVATVVLLIASVLVVGNLYLRLHALPEQLAHRGKKVQLEIVAVLALVALFTHQHLFWIAALLLALIPLPDFSTPVASMARSLEKIARDREVGKQPEEQAGQAPIQPDPGPPVPAPDPAPPVMSVADTPPAAKPPVRG